MVGYSMNFIIGLGERKGHDYATQRMRWNDISDQQCKGCGVYIRRDTVWLYVYWRVLLYAVPT